MLLMTSFGESLFQLIIVLVIFIGVLAATYFVTKWLANYQKAASYNKNLEIVETIRLTTNKYVQIVRAGSDSFYVIAIGKDEITMLGQIDKDGLILSDDTEAADFKPMDFKSILERVKNNNRTLH